MWAEDPVGRLVDPGQTYFSEDTFYLDVTQPDPLLLWKIMDLAMRAANHARPNVYDFPTLCGWAVGALSGLGDINNSVALVHELELAQKAGVTKYTKVAIRLEPDMVQLQGRKHRALAACTSPMSSCSAFDWNATEFDAACPGQLLESRDEIGERAVPIYGGLWHTEQIQVWPVSGPECAASP